MERRGGGRIINLSTGSGEVFRRPEELPKLENIGEFSLAVIGIDLDDQPTTTA